MSSYILKKLYLKEYVKRVTIELSGTTIEWTLNKQVAARFIGRETEAVCFLLNNKSFILESEELI